jgi:mannosyltransferase OCH1-like enzyme
MIPKIIHQIWVGDQSKRPDKLIQTWIDKNPSWQHKLWTDDNLPNLICKKQFDECGCICRWDGQFEP